jgi:hypothetical protein
MDNLPLRHTKWSDRLAMDVALALEGSGETMQEVMDRHEIGIEDIARFNKDPVFLKKVEALRNEVRDKGLTFKMKARAQAEELLTTSWVLIHDPTTSPAVKADLIKSTVKWAGLEPKNDVQSVEAGGGVKITINLGGQEHEVRPTQPAIEDAEYTEVEE